jgi:hypothetical protein
MSEKCLPEAEMKQTQSTLGGFNLGESDSSTTVQRRSWSGGRSEHDVSAAWLARGSFDHASRAGAGYRNFENMMRLSPLDLARASRSFGLAHDFCGQSMERKSLSALYYCSDFGTFNIDCRPPRGLRFAISFF